MDEVEKYREAISVAAEMADDAMPGWYRNIDPDILKMWDYGKCIVGQSISRFVPSDDYVIYSEGIRSVFGVEGDTYINPDLNLTLGSLLVRNREDWLEEVTIRVEAEKNAKVKMEV